MKRKLRLRYFIACWLLYRMSTYERMKFYFQWKETHRRLMELMFKRFKEGKGRLGPII